MISPRHFLLGALLLGSLTGSPLPGHAQLVRQANSTLALPPTLPAASGYTTENALGSLTFNGPIAVRAQPGVSNRLFVVERGGAIQLVNLDTMQKTLFLDLAGFLSAPTRNTPLTTESECGLLSMALHPNFSQNGFFFVFYSFRAVGPGDSTSRLYQRVARFRAAGSAPFTAANIAADTATHTPLITQLDEAGNHNGGDIHFGPDGYLYVSVGDEGDANDSRDNARYINKDFFGAIMRLDVDVDPATGAVGRPGSLPPNPHAQAAPMPYNSAVTAGAYRIPPDNPFIGRTSHQGRTFNADTVRTEFWVSGLRNPFRFSFDPPTNRLFCADVGQNSREEVSLLSGGDDAGWSYREGKQAFTAGPGGATPPAGFAPREPIYDYGRNGAFGGSSVTGGVLYRGNRLTELFETYIFCDFNSAHIWALRLNGTTWNVEALTDNGGIAGFGLDPRNGDVLMCDLYDNIVRRLIRTGQTGMPPPQFLSQTGAFSNLSTLTPNAGIVAYDVNVPFWSDNAIKQRWFSVPNLPSKMTFSADGNWSFPAGEVWVKHFEIDVPGTPPTRRRLETRFIVKNAAGAYGITYKWNAGGTDAELVPDAGLDETIPGTTQVWRYPSRNECMTCHTPVAGYALSFNTRQLNRNKVFNGQTQNQIAALHGADYFTNVTAPTVNNLPAFARANDTSKSLEHRVRSYLAVNCVSCHQPGGAAVGNWDARPTTRTDDAGLINGPLNDNGGDAANRVLVPGDANHSMLLRRMMGAGVQRMPNLATNVRDIANEQLVSDWITDATAGLPARQTFAQWQQAQFGSTTTADALPGADPDGDGLSNEQEWLLRTDPKGAASRWSLTLAPVNGTPMLSFTQPAGRASVVETSADLQTWSLWDVPGNAPDYPAGATPRAFQVSPAGGAHQFFRVRVLQE